MHATLQRLYGPVMSGKALQKVLGFSSAEALRSAVSRGRVGVRTFKIEGRPGRFAVTSEVADFLQQQQQASSVDALTPLGGDESRVKSGRNSDRKPQEEIPMD